MSRNASRRSISDPEQAADCVEQLAGSGKPAYKRRRIALACTSCRNRKSRCNGAKPSCSLCVQLGFQCVYEQPASLHEQPGARSAEGYEARLTSIEDTLKLLLNQSSAAHQLRSRNESTSSNSVVRAADDSHALDVATLGEGEADLLDNSEDSVDGMATIAETRGNDKRFFGPSSNIALLGEISSLLAASMSFMEGTRRNSPSRDQLVSRMPSPQTSIAAPTPATLPSGSPCALPSELHGVRMIEKFFSDTGVLFPFVSKSYIVRTYKDAILNRYRDVRRSWLCLLNMLFAFATFTDVSGSYNMEKNLQESKVYFNRAQDLLAESRLRLADLEVVQCLLLMSQYRQGTQRSDETWSLHGLAVHAATQIGLHCAQTTCGMETSEMEMRKRTWFACILLDSTLSMTLGRPLSVPKDYTQMNLPQPVVSEQDSQSDEVDTLCFFTQTIKLYTIQNDIISQLYRNNLSRHVELGIESTLPALLKFENQLDNWARQLEPPLRSRPWVEYSRHDPRLNVTMERLGVILRLRHLHTCLLLHRATLRALTTSCGQDHSHNDFELNAFSGRLTQQSLSSGLLAAVEIVRIVHEMSKVPSNLGSAWFSIYYTFHAMLMLVKCLIFHFGHPPTITGLPKPVWNSGEIGDSAKALVNGKEAITRIGQGNGSSKRICKSLSRMFKACVRVAEASSEDATPLQPLLAQTNNTSGNVPGDHGGRPDILYVDGSSQAIDMDLLDFNMQDEFGFLSALVSGNCTMCTQEQCSSVLSPTRMTGCTAGQYILQQTTLSLRRAIQTDDMSRVPWDRMIRFQATDGRVLRGQPILPAIRDFDIGKVSQSDNLRAHVIVGDDIFSTDGSTKVTGEIVTVKRLLGPLTQKDVPILRCVGLNYVKHIREAGRTAPPFPFIFFKPNTCVWDHNADVEIPKIAQDDQADYEGELCLVIGRDAKDVSIKNALSYVGAYTVGNDISSRKLQRDPNLAGRIPQWGFSKGFDQFAPLGPCLVRADLISDPKALRLRTIIDGQVRQDELVEDLLFDCAYLVSYLSQGTTLQKGSVIMTGTPGGVGAGLDPPKYLAPGTRMEVSITSIGTLVNGIVFA